MIDSVSLVGVSAIMLEIAVNVIYAPNFPEINVTRPKTEKKSTGFVQIERNFH